MVITAVIINVSDFSTRMSCHNRLPVALTITVDELWLWIAFYVISIPHLNLRYSVPHLSCHHCHVCVSVSLSLSLLIPVCCIRPHYGKRSNGRWQAQWFQSKRRAEALSMIRWRLTGRQRYRHHNKLCRHSNSWIGKRQEPIRQQPSLNADNFDVV